jgi:hypothetical protein
MGECYEKNDAVWFVAGFAGGVFGMRQSGLVVNK